MDGIEQETRADLVEVGVIQYIRGLHAKLNIHAFTKAGVLEQRSVPAPGARPEYRTPGCVSRSNAVCGRISKQRTVKPLPSRMRGVMVRIPELVRTSIKEGSAIEVSQTEPCRINVYAVDSEP